MMRIDIITVLPEMLEGFLHTSILQRAQDKGLAELHLHNLRDYSTNRWKRVDADYPYGGAAEHGYTGGASGQSDYRASQVRPYDEVIYTSPDGEYLTQPVANQLSLLNNIIILCGHYKGIDHRIREHLITREISIGDFVVTGGELPAAVITDSVVLLPGVLGNEEGTLSIRSKTTYLPLRIHPPCKVQWVERAGSVTLRARGQNKCLATRAGYGTH